MAAIKGDAALEAIVGRTIQNAVSLSGVVVLTFTDGTLISFSIGG